ncbi:MAG: hypothetical protein ACK4HN_07365 [Thermosynechococcus sp.]|uniref:hypothetical protein n=1 Tax=Thermosynechococcus sp. TaxID=2814275 RepID=UPI00391A06F3
MKHSKAVSLFLSLGIAGSLASLVPPAGAASDPTPQLPEVKTTALGSEALTQITGNGQARLLLAGSEEGGEEGGYGERGEYGKRRRRWWW